MSMVHPYYHALIILSSTIDSTIAIQQSSVPNSSNYDAPVVTDLSNNNLPVHGHIYNQYIKPSTERRINRHCGQSLTSVEVLAQLQAKEKVKQRKVRASTKKTTTSDIKRKRSQQQVLDEIDALSDLDPQSDFNITTSSTAIDSNRLTTGTNNYQYIDTDPSRHISFYDTQQQPQIYPSCYRCNTVIYGNFTNCNK
ncbi:unnamed protein product [Rotaria magnacalcarata]|uniref:Uncharacterized protein n=1 Tax=Rotaria magnacalcarata TaxID=392030 RepID=A0A816MKU7_9BILA|nr:unnamed protein product [Rotaria magnacalcarata]CAF2090907.1 unnamed protein product [Rotaria magnacalcarata]CAF4280134.1 unnamed protein product [Rotaria magnacalcarata]CAF4426264.1 unnamed protein product [Rotaria magnacalcarata]